MSEWKSIVKRILKSELAKRGLSIDDLTLLLKKHGYHETRSSVNSKISRGTFSAVFFLQCLDIIGCTNLKIEEYCTTLQDSKRLSLIMEEPNTEYNDDKNEE